MDGIKAYILEQGLKPGDPLPTEIQLCEKLNVSRSPVREAVRQLEALNIVSVEHGKGTFVGSLSLEPLVETLAFRASIPGPDNLVSLRDVVEVRRYLDIGNAQQVVDSLSGTEQPQLAALVETMEMKAQEGVTFQDEDISFHLGLLAHTNNEIAKQLVHGLWLVHMAAIPELGLEITNRLEGTAHAHRLMLEAALAGDVPAYQQAVVAHYEPLEEILYTRVRNG